MSTYFGGAFAGTYWGPFFEAAPVVTQPTLTTGDIAAIAAAVAPAVLAAFLASSAFQTFVASGVLVDPTHKINSTAIGQVPASNLPTDYASSLDLVEMTQAFDEMSENIITNVNTHTDLALSEFDPGSSGGDGSFTQDDRDVINSTQSYVLSMNSSEGKVVNPVVVNNDMILEPGFDYFLDDGLAPTWSNSGWPDLAGAVITFLVNDASLFGYATGASPVQVVYVNVPRTFLPEEHNVTYTYYLWADLNNGDKVLLAKASLDVG